MTSPNRIRRVLVTGAAGKTGLALLKQLATRSSGSLLRALARDPGQRALLAKAGAQEIVVGDLADREALEQALESVDAVYHICPNVHPDEGAIGQRLIDLTQQAGVRRFVFHSVLEPRIREMPHHWAKAQVEDLLAKSNLDFTILQPAPYMQNVLSQQSSLRKQGLYRVPYALSTRVPMVDLEEVAEAAARVLLGSEHSGAAYELCTPGLLDQSQIAAELGRVLGRDVDAEVEDRGAWARSASAAGMSNYQVETLLAMFRYYERSGMTGSHLAMTTLLGRQPRSFPDFAVRALG